MTNTILNTKIGGVQKKIPGNSSLLTATILNAKAGKIQNKFPDHDKYNKFAGSIFDTKVNLATNSDVNTVEQCANKIKTKIEKVQMFDLSYFFSKNFSVKMVFKKYFFIKQHPIRQS